MTLKERNSRSRLETRDRKTDILDPVSIVEISLSQDTAPLLKKKRTQNSHFPRPRETDPYVRVRFS